MRRRRQGAFVVGCAALALAGWQLSTPSTAVAAGQQSQARSHPGDAVPLLDATAPIGNDAVFNNMDYNGGPVMPSNTDYIVQWAPAGGIAYPDGYLSGVSQYFLDLQHDSGGNQNVDSVSSQYQDLTGAFARNQTTFGGVLVDTDPYPASQCPVGPVNTRVNPPETSITNCITDAQIETELTAFVTANGLPTDLSHEYFLLPPPGVADCFTNDPTQSYGGCSADEPHLAAFCAYHENTSLSPMLLYSVDFFDASNGHCSDGKSPNGSPSSPDFAGLEINGGLSHEHNESVTDPVPNDAWTNGFGADQGEEVGDQCTRQMGTPLGTASNGNPYNQVINGHLYWYQEEWSNQTAQCLQRLSPSPARPVAHFTATAGSGLTINFDAHGSGAPGGVSQYVWQLNAVLNQQTFESTSPTFSYTFPSAGAYSVGLTVFESNGTSTGTGGIVTTGQNGTTPGFTEAPTHARAGTPVSFSALGNVSAQPVITYLWLFGDGTTGSGQFPSHTYAQPGRYTVSLVMFSGVGSAFPGQGAAPISQLSFTVTG